MLMNYSSDEFHKLLDALAGELVSASIHYELYRNLEAALSSEYSVVYSNAPAFWSGTLKAHIDVTLMHLSKAYDTYENKKKSKTLHLQNLLKIIVNNLHLFDDASFRERLKSNLHVDSLAKQAMKPTKTDLKEDTKRINLTNPQVKKLNLWRNKLYAH